jgi:hypothetical protein
MVKTYVNAKEGLYDNKVRQENHPVVMRLHGNGVKCTGRRSYPYLTKIMSDTIIFVM